MAKFVDDLLERRWFEGKSKQKRREVESESSESVRGILFSTATRTSKTSGVWHRA